MPKKTISDSIAKTQCANYLRRLGYKNVGPSNGMNCDLTAYKNGELFMFEIKYSSLKEGSKFFGTVMFTELYRAITTPKNYLFLVCRGLDERLDNWFYQLFTVEEFLKFCTLTTPIGHYHLKFDDKNNPLEYRVGKDGVMLTEELILDIWKNYRKWKPERLASGSQPGLDS